MVQLSIIIAYYKRTDFLKLILAYLEKQVSKDFEVVIAEDDDSLRNDLSVDLSNYSFCIKHVYQEDKGFRKCKILNQAINVIASDYVVFLDGDCLPHKNLVLEYKRLSNLDSCFGRRVMLNQSLSNRLLEGKAHVSLANLIMHKTASLKHHFYFPSRKVKQVDDKGIWGCNWGIQRKHLLSVNGFDEDYELAGIGEDVDIEWRLRKNGVKVFYAKHRPIVYHLFHKSHYNDGVVEEGMKMLKEKQKKGLTYCENGLLKPCYE